VFLKISLLTKTSAPRSFRSSSVFWASRTPTLKLPTGATRPALMPLPVPPLLKSPPSA
jgi:hypothetical protein